MSAKYLDADYPRDGVRKTPHGRPTSTAAESAPIDRGSPAITAAASRLGCRRPASRFAPARPEARSLSAEEYQAELDRIELELSVMVIEEPTAWSFDSLRERTNVLLDQAQTAVERGRARLLANKIARFDDIKQRQDAVLAMRDETDRDSRL